MTIYHCAACGKSSVATVSHHCLAGSGMAAIAAAPVPAGAAAAVGTRTLAHYVRSRSSMDLDPTASIVPQTFRQKWDHALSNFLSYGSVDQKSTLLLGRQATIGRYTLADYAAMSDSERYAVLNLLWHAQVLWVKSNQRATEMYDAPPGDAVHFTSSTGNRVAGAFSRFGIGFRSEKEADIGRVLKEGFRPLFRNIVVAESLGYHVGGTVMETLTRKEEIAFYLVNKDVVGNTGICVARNMRGATKFPEPTFTGAIYTFAVRPRNLGYDTETWQASLGNTAVWRPGEKVFPTIAVDDVIAYTKVQKTAGGTDANMWTFQCLDASWRYLKPVTPAERDYLDGELAALRALGASAVPKADDFYRN